MDAGGEEVEQPKQVTTAAVVDDVDQEPVGGDDVSPSIVEDEEDVEVSLVTRFSSTQFHIANCNVFTIIAG